MPNSFFVTPGDIDGIGLEVCLKAFNGFDKVPGTSSFKLNNFYTIWVHESQVEQVKNTVSQPHFINDDNLDAFFPKKLNFIVTKKNPVECFIASIKNSLKNDNQGILTGPLSKNLICSSGYANTIGHTGLLKKFIPSELRNSLVMAFKGSSFSVVLCTDHIPLKEVPDTLTPELIFNAYKCGLKFNSLFNLKGPIGILGLNPHAGDNGLIGSEESSGYPYLDTKIYPYTLLPPDGAFMPNIRNHYSCFLAAYHDQGLAPFKAVHGTSGVHITMGLPFVRLSVDHGTAKDLFNKNIASPQSMIDMIQLAETMESINDFNTTYL